MPAQGEPQPIGRGAFGNIYDQFRGRAKEAIDFLLRRKEGDAVGALHHKDVGDIDIWYGNDRAGLKKIAAKHPEVLNDLQGVIDGMHVVTSSDNRIVLESDTHRAIVSKMLGNKKTDNWLLTAYEKKGTSASSSDIETEPEGKRNGTAAPQSSLSGGKDTKISENGEKKSDGDSQVGEGKGNRNPQLAVLERYEIDEDDTQFDQDFGLMRTAIKKAEKDVNALAKRIAAELGISTGRKNLAKEDIHPAGGSITSRIPLTSNRELYVSVGFRTKYGQDEHLKTETLFFRIEDPTAEGQKRYVGRNNFFNSYQIPTFDNLVQRIKSEVRNMVPEFENEPIKTERKPPATDRGDRGATPQETTAEGEPQPIGRGAFGEIYDQFRGKVREAFEFLMRHKGGDLLGVFHREDIGDIDLVWGSAKENMGLEHIIEKHVGDGKSFATVEEAKSEIENVINNGEKAFENGDKVVFKAGRKQVTIRKNYREEGKKKADKNWVLTAYDELSADSGSPAATNQDKAGNVAEQIGGKDTKISENNKKSGEKKSEKEREEARREVEQIASQLDKGNTPKNDKLIQRIADMAEEAEEALESGNLTEEERVRQQARFDVADEWLDNNVRGHKADGVKPVTKREARLRDAVVDLLRKAGIEVVTESEEGQRVLDEANGKARQHRVYHGSGADFEAFDHSHMGEGEGAQAFGWGTYVTEVEGIGRQYAESMGKDRQNKPMQDKYYEISKNRETYLRKVWEFQHTDDTEEKRQLKAEMERLSAEADRLWEEYHELEDKVKSVLYTVEIPEDNGSNYLEWDKPIGADLAKQIQDFAFEQFTKSDFWRSYYADEATVKADLQRIIEPEGDMEWTMKSIESRHIPAKAFSDFLHSLGYVGIKYPADYFNGGNEDGKSNYVIFDEGDLQITDKVRFFRTEGGEAYGFTMGGKIYIDPKIATAETPVHEYTHLWAEALRTANPKAWARLKEEMAKDKELVDWVKSKYPEWLGLMGFRTSWPRRCLPTTAAGAVLSG